MSVMCMYPNGWYVTESDKFCGKMRKTWQRIVVAHLK